MTVALLLLLTQKEKPLSVVNYLMSRFPLFEQTHLAYDSLIYLPNSASANEMSKQFASSLAAFNKTYRNVPPLPLPDV